MITGEMKKVIYIVIAVFALGLASCSKQEIQPVNDSDTVVPVWKSNSTGENVIDPNGSSNEGGITDPNTGEEESLQGGI